VKARDEQPSSLSGGCGFRLSILFPARSKTSTSSVPTLEAYTRSDSGSTTRSWKDHPFAEEFPVSVKNLDPSITGVRDIDFIVLSIDGDGGGITKLPIGCAYGSP